MAVTTRAIRSRRTRRPNVAGYFFIAPALALYLVFNIWPLIRGFLMAFTDYRFVYEETRWSFDGLANFGELFHDKDFWGALGVTIRYLLLVFPVVVVVSLFLAVLIGKVARGAGFYRWLVYLPVVLPIAVTFLMFGEVYNYRFGLLNSILRGVGLANPPNWLGSTQWTLPALAAADIWRSTGLPTLLFLIGIYGISQDIYDAAALDGASGWQQFHLITLPLLKPIFALVLLLNLTALPVVTEPMLILTNGGPQNASLTIGLYAYQVAFQRGDLRLGYAAAMNLVVGLASAAIALGLFRALRERPERRSTIA